MSTEVLTAQQYRNRLRLSLYLDRLRAQIDPLDHARRAGKGLRVQRKLSRLFRTRPLGARNDGPAR